MTFEQKVRWAATALIGLGVLMVFYIIVVLGGWREVLFTVLLIAAMAIGLLLLDNHRMNKRRRH